MSPTDDEVHANKKAKMVTAATLQSIEYANEDGKTPKLKVLDQLLLPSEKVYITVPDVATAYTVIKTMQIRGNSATNNARNFCYFE